MAEILSGVKIAGKEQEIYAALEKGMAAVSECITREAHHECIGKLHVYVLGTAQESFIREKFPFWKEVRRNNVSVFCVREGSLKKIASMIRQAVKGDP
ncbi:MAG: hypothetical protein UY41_C0016G0011 [Candidatus Moranbacteria bacterium GW2011_GWE1_49_15]|nr:MAG: hypothetical protein UX75_C0023G0009 [Candidatus Moranbacteria bacterium GW2011_GWE2_47_10]KKW06741.1 MAG: hypothetical protein UY41_C0016G0011 [Candidatus Moranbacteria bacterium GW2011_GWE1_49_15]HBP00783.1 hypothetical protein [Candidatus Moranbacteria bacterium]